MINHTRKLVYCLLLVSLNSLLAANTSASSTDSLIRRGIALSIAQDYEAALALFSALERQMPKNPAGYFFQAAVLQFKMMDHERYDETDLFRQKLVRTITVSRDNLKKNKNDAWAHFYTGAAYGYLAFSQAKQMQLVDAFKNGRSSIVALEKALAVDSTLYDAYLGLGTYKYYRSGLSRHLAWLPFIEDERAAGMMMVRRAMAKSHYSQFSALNSLCWILIEEKRYEESYRLIRSVLTDYPDNRTFLWCAAKLAKKMSRWHEAVEYYQEILHSFAAQGVHSPYNELSCRKNLIELYQTLGESALTEKECGFIKQFRLDPQPQKRTEKKLKEVTELCVECTTETAMLKSMD
jgi:tetratricopeptide (TPR) repeat protein